MTRDLVADIDAAIDQKCACPCGAAITAASPSAYFASELCAVRWHRRAAYSPAFVAFADEFDDTITTAVRAVFAQVAAGVTSSLNAAGAALRAFVETVGPLAAKLAPLLLPADGVPPSDPMDRALWLRQHRNTGPKQTPAVPRRLDPGIGLSVVARGRPVTQHRTSR